MDIQQYINSGILENYVLGLVSETEAQEVERNLLAYPELKTELNKIEDALATYAQAKAKPMPEGLSSSILQSIQKLETSPSPTSDATTQPKAAVPKTNNTLGIILGVALLGSLLGAFFLNQQKQELQNQLTLAESEVIEVNDKMVALQLGCDEKDGTIQRLQEYITILKNPAYKPVSMNGTDLAPSVKSVVYYNVAESRTYFDIGNLPDIPADRSYQLWAIIDGKPTDMGIFDLTNSNGGLVEVPHIINPQAFAVTLEAKGGNTTPNLDALYVIGNV